MNKVFLEESHGLYFHHPIVVESIRKSVMKTVRMRQEVDLLEVRALVRGVMQSSPKIKMNEVNGKLSLSDEVDLPSIYRNDLVPKLNLVYTGLRHIFGLDESGEIMRTMIEDDSADFEHLLIKEDAKSLQMNNLALRFDDDTISWDVMTGVDAHTSIMGSYPAVTLVRNMKLTNWNSEAKCGGGIIYSRREFLPDDENFMLDNPSQENSYVILPHGALGAELLRQYQGKNTQKFTRRPALKVINGGLSTSNQNGDSPC